MQRVFGIILLFILISFGVFASIVMRYDVERREVNRQVALLKAQTVLSDTQTKQQIALIVAQERLEKVKLRSDPAVKASLVQAVKVRAVLSAWLPIYAPIFLFAGLSSVAAVYYSFRLVTFRHEGIETPVRAFDAPRLVSQSLQVKALEATQGVDVLQLAETIAMRQLNTFGHLARGMRGIMASKDAPAMLTAPAAMPAEVFPVPTFAEAMRDMKPGKVLIGYDKGKPIHLDEADFVSCGLAGAAGSGKTTKERFLFSQLAIHGVRLPVLDAHSGHPESLVSSLGDIVKLPNVTVYSPIDTRETIDFFMNDLEDALKHPERKNERTVYVIEELLPIVDTVPKTANFILKAATEGRKFERFVFAAGQVWPASLFQKGSCVRDSLTLRMSARNDELQARLLFKTREKAKIVEGLKLHQMFVNSVQFQGVVDVPFCTRQDMNALAATVSQTAMPMGESDDVNDTELVNRIKARFPQNNELARLIDRDKGQVSNVLNHPERMTPSMRQAFISLLQTV